MFKLFLGAKPLNQGLNDFLIIFSQKQNKQNEERRENCIHM